MSKLSERKSWSVEKRLEFIEFRLFWDGYIQRADISKHFGVSTPQASSDIALYKERAPKNLEYDSSAKQYVASKGFDPVIYKPDPSRYLTQLKTIQETILTPQETYFGQMPEFELLPVLDRSIGADVLRSILKAIRNRSGIRIKYQSMNEMRPEPIWREISPHALASDGFRWHARAYCHLEEKYKDFILSRILDTDDFVRFQQAQTGDKEWDTTFDVILVPNPNFSEHQKKVIELDYGMQNGRCVVTIKLALLYYFNKRMRLDVAAKHDRPKETPLVVENLTEFNSQLKAVAI